MKTTCDASLTDINQPVLQAYYLKYQDLQPETSNGCEIQFSICLSPVLQAYYLKYQNRRPEYISAFWNVVNWEQVNKNFTTAKAGEVPL